jgi:hypothetical protein
MQYEHRLVALPTIEDFRQTVRTLVAHLIFRDGRWRSAPRPAEICAVVARSHHPLR